MVGLVCGDGSAALVSLQGHVGGSADCCLSLHISLKMALGTLRPRDTGASTYEFKFGVTI